MERNIAPVKVELWIDNRLDKHEVLDLEKDLIPEYKEWLEKMPIEEMEFFGYRTHVKWLFEAKRANWEIDNELGFYKLMNRAWTEVYDSKKV